MKPTFTIGAFAIIPDDSGSVLLCHRCDFDAWNLPGGTVEHGESPWLAVIRETEEETGLHVIVQKLLGIYSKPDKNEIVFSFQCEISGGNITMTDEADRIEYFAINALPDTLLEKQRQRIHDWESNNSQPCMKVQFSNRHTQQMHEPATGLSDLTQ